MKYAKLVETDAEWCEQFRAHLIVAEGAQLTTDPTLLLVPNDCDLDKYHGVESHLEIPKPIKPFAEENADVIAWLESYTGNFSFYLSLKQQYQQKGKLSDKQVDAVVRAMERDATKAETQKNAPPQEYSIKPGQIIQLTKWAAKQFAERAKHTRPHYAFEVIRAEAETEKAIRLTVKLTAQRTAFCSVCGMSLTNPESVTAGIGPICAEKSGVSFSGAALDELAAKLMQTIQVTDWLPKKAIKTVDGKPYNP